MELQISILEFYQQFMNEKLCADISTAGSLLRRQGEEEVGGEIEAMSGAFEYLAASLDTFSDHITLEKLNEYSRLLKQGADLVEKLMPFSFEGMAVLRLRNEREFCRINFECQAGKIAPDRIYEEKQNREVTPESLIKCLQHTATQFDSLVAKHRLSNRSVAEKVPTPT